jgi:hypothetical protein
MSAVLAKKVSPLQGFFLLTLIIATGSMVSIAVKTRAWWLGLAVVPLALAIALLGRRPTSPVSKNGPLWLPLDAVKEQIVAWLEKETQLVASALHMKEKNVRANVFAPDDSGDMLHMVRDLSVRMTDAEKDVHIPAGIGCIGACFQSHEAMVAPDDLRGKIHVVRGAQRRGVYSLTAQESAKLPHDLRWVISAPISADRAVIGVLSIDGLAPPGESKPSKRALNDVSQQVTNCAAKIGALLARP